jgi:segregation and condensation protein A
METVVLDPEKFSIKTSQFEGPLELLIELVEKRKLLINEISLAEVTDEYMARVSEMQERSLPNTAQFINLAATLLLIKSKSLLPMLEINEEEESNIEALEERLKRYQLYRQASTDVSDTFGNSYQFLSQYVPKREPVFTPDALCNVTTLNETLEQLLRNLPTLPKRQSVTVRPTITIEEMIERLRQRIANQVTTYFSEIQRAEGEHKNVIVGFLAILELVKQGDVLVAQHARFSDIEIVQDRQTTPRYY